MENINNLNIEKQEADIINNIENQNIFATINNNFNLIKEKPMSFIIAILLPLLVLIYSVIISNNILLFSVSFIIFLLYYIINTSSFITESKMLRFFKITFIYLICIFLSYWILNLNFKELSNNSSLKWNSKETIDIIKNTQTIITKQDKEISDLQIQIEQIKKELSETKNTSEKSVSILNEAIWILKTKK